MTSRIHKNLNLITGVHFNDKFYVNEYDIDLTLNVETDSILDQNIALDRIKYFLHECLEHSIFVHQTNTKAIEKYMDANINVCTLPEEPYDQVVGIM